MPSRFMRWIWGTRFTRLLWNAISFLLWDQSAPPLLYTAGSVGGAATMREADRVGAVGRHHVDVFALRVAHPLLLGLSRSVVNRMKPSLAFSWPACGTASQALRGARVRTSADGPFRWFHLLLWLNGVHEAEHPVVNRVDAVNCWPTRSVSQRCLGPRRRDNGRRLFSMSLAKWLRNKRLDPRLIGIWRREGYTAPLSL